MGAARQSPSSVKSTKRKARSGRRRPPVVSSADIQWLALAVLFIVAIVAAFVLAGGDSTIPGPHSG
ncbi:MAG: hypothetical protein ACFCVK_20145 [Acidimicrobiales bacterium]